MDAPLIVTLRLDPAAQLYFDGLRTRYFPAERLFVGAHVTMFHALPAGCEMRLVKAVSDLCQSEAVFNVGIKGLRFLGRGIAYDLIAPEALRLRAALAAQFAGELTRQDSARWVPHVTVQNKVEPAHARQTMAALGGAMYSAPVSAIGVGVWRYAGGPWDHVRNFAFRELGRE